jgi:PAS domain S-box-containing protein
MSSNHPFLTGGGELAELIAVFDWSATPLGPLGTWPQHIKSVVSLILRSPVPMVLLWGADGVMIYNDAYSVFAAARHPHLLGSKVRAGWPEVADFNDNVMKVGLAGGTLAYRDQELTLYRNGGPEQVWMDLDYSPILDQAGEPAGVMAIVTETAEKAIVQEELRKSEARLKALNADLERQVLERTVVGGRFWEITADLLGVLRADGYFERANPAWLTLLGWTEAEVQAMSIFELLHIDDRERTRAGFAHLQGGNPIHRFENRYRGKDGGYKWFAWAAIPYGDAYYASGRDITAEKASAAALESAQEALRQSQKMEAVGQLTGGLAHDFNNLLAGISGSLELLSHRLTQGRYGEMERYIAAAQGASKRAAALTHRLLAFARRQTLDAKPLSINRIAVDMEELIRRTVGPAINTEIVQAGGLWSVKIDANQLENALLNLCINARDAMPDGGALMIETGNRWFDERTARDRDLSPGQYVSLCVSDTGTGMPPEVVARAFDPFFTTKPIGSGTGLGLSMIYGFVRQSGGQVRIYSEVGKGTMVCLYFPRHRGESEQPDAAVDSGAVIAPGQGQTVLVVDDEPTIRMLVTDVLTEIGYRTLEAADGGAGLKILQGGDRIDLLVTDVGLPGGLNGRQMADAGRKLRPQLEILFITGYAENAVLSHGHLEPGMHVLTKPFAIDQFAARVTELLKTPPSNARANLAPSNVSTTNDPRNVT